MRSASLALLFLAGAIAASCASPEEIDKAGTLGGECYPNGTCDASYVCLWGICNFPDAGTDAIATGGVSGAVSTGGTAGVSGGAAGSGASSGMGGLPTGGSGGFSTGGVGATGGIGATGGVAATGGVGATGGAGTGGTTGNLPPPTNVKGCTSCACCDPWNITWSPVTGATRYDVAWKCSIFPVHVIDVKNVTKVDLCSSAIGMCNVSECANGVGAVSVQACNASGCSAQAFVTVGLPLACGGGCCC